MASDSMEDFKRIALANRHPFHLAAFVKNGASYIVGVNSKRESGKYIRYYNDGNISGQLHAEVALLRKLKDVPSKIHVIRVTKAGKVTMALPCADCQTRLRRAGVKTVWYTDWEGEWEKLEL